MSQILVKVPTEKTKPSKPSKKPSEISGVIQELHDQIAYVVEAIMGEPRDDLVAKTRVYVNKKVKCCISTNLPMVLSASKSGVT